MDVDLRKLRYFVAVAEELHFGRAAERLHIGQPVLSRQIRALEHELRAELFRRDRRSTELTDAGRQLLADATGLLASAQALQRRVQLAARGARRFTVAFMPGVIVTAPVQALARSRPALEIDVLRTSYADQVAVIHDGRADVSFIRMPAEQRGLKLLPLYSEPRVVVLPAGHRLAGKATLSIHDLAGERLLQDPDAVPEWRDLPRPDGVRAVQRPIATVEEKLEYVAAGQGMVILPLSAAAYYTRTDVAGIPVDDIGPSQVCLAWSAERRSTLIEEFVAAAKSATNGEGA